MTDQDLQQPSKALDPNSANTLLRYIGIPPRQRIKLENSGICTLEELVEYINNGGPDSLTEPRGIGHIGKDLIISTLLQKYSGAQHIMGLARKTQEL